VRPLAKRLLIRLDPKKDKVGRFYIPEAYQKITEAGTIIAAATDSPFKPGQHVWYDRSVFGYDLPDNQKIIWHKDLLTVDDQPIDDIVMCKLEVVEDIRKVGNLWVNESDAEWWRESKQEQGFRQGTILAVGPDVKNLRVGDKIYFPAMQFVVRTDINNKDLTFLHESEVFLKEVMYKLEV
jgi:co-chaperonin GroES (HSP10)